MHPFVIFPLVKKIIFQYIVDTCHFGSCCCLTVNRSVRCVRIMRLPIFSKNTFLDLCPADYCYVAILYAPTCLLCLATQCPPKGENHSCPSSHAISGCPFCTCTGSSTHQGVPCLRTRILKSLWLPCCLLPKVLLSPEIILSPSVFSIHPSSLAPQCRNLPPPTLNTNTTDVLLLPLPIHLQNIFYSSPCLHQGSQRLPPPLYPVSFSHTSYTGRNATHSSTVVCRRLIYYPKVCVPVCLRTPPPVYTSHTTAAALFSLWPFRFDNYHFGGDKDNVELHILILLVWLGGNWTKKVINGFIWIILPCWPGGIFTLWKIQQ